MRVAVDWLGDDGRAVLRQIDDMPTSNEKAVLAQVQAAVGRQAKRLRNMRRRLGARRFKVWLEDGSPL